MPIGTGFLAATGRAVGYTAGTITLAGVLAFSDGSINVHVQEHKAEGHNIYLFVPAMLAPMAVSFLPQDKKEEIARHIGECLPVVKAAATELNRIPDGPLVQVDSIREHVSIAKRGGSLVIDVEDGRDTVHVSFPTRTVLQVVEELEAAGAKK